MITLGDKLKDYLCGSCGHKFSRDWKPDTTGIDLTTCPCEKCGAQSIQTDEKPYQIYRDSIAEKNLIGNLMLSTAEEIHGDNISFINYSAHRIIVRYSISEEVWNDIKTIPKPLV